MSLVLGFLLTCTLLVLAAPTMINLLTGMHRVNAIMLGKEIHTRLPPGSSLPTVESFLEKHYLPLSYEPSSRTLYVVVQEVKGSSFLLRKDVAFHFHFNKCYKLESTDAKTMLTGL